MGPPIRRAMGTKDISNLQPWAWQRQRTSLRPSVSQLRQQLVGAVGIPDQLSGDMGVLRGGAELGVTEQDLNDPYICPGFQ